MSRNYKRRIPPPFQVDRRDEGFQDGSGLHVAELLVREIELTVTLRQRAREKRARAEQCRKSPPAASGVSFAGIPEEQWLAHAESLPPQSAAERKAMLDALGNDLDALELETAAEAIRTRVVGTLAHALDHAAHAELTKAKQIASRRAIGDRNRRHLEAAIEALLANDLPVTLLNVRNHWADGVHVPEDRYLSALIAEWRLRTNQLDQ